MQASATEWHEALERALTQPGAVRLVLQPIVDLRRGSVVGHELLARFRGPPEASPDVWFAAAERLGRGEELAALTVRLGLEQLAQLPPNTFLTLNLEPQYLQSDAVLRALDESPRLDRLFIELTEHAVVERPDELSMELEAFRARGARIAVDDAGTGYAGLSLLLALRPELVKLDRGLITRLDRDPVKRVLVRALGELAGTIDAWVLAEGIETTEELAELVSLEVPLGQGYLLGRPQEGFTPEIPSAMLEAIADRHHRNAYPDLAASLQQRVAITGEHDPVGAGSGLRIVVDELGRPVALDTADGERSWSPLLAKPSETLASLAQRIVARRDGRWTDPVVLTSGQGSAVGIVAVDRLLERLANSDR